MRHELTPNQKLENFIDELNKLPRGSTYEISFGASSLAIVDPHELADWLKTHAKREAV